MRLACLLATALLIAGSVRAADAPKPPTIQGPLKGDAEAAPAPDPNHMTLTFTLEEVNVLASGLGELPLKVSAGTFADLQRQAQVWKMSHQQPPPGPPAPVPATK